MPNSNKIDIETARKAKEKAKTVLQGLQFVNGIGITKKDGGYAVRVNLEVELDSPDLVPAEIDGVPVLTKVRGKIKKQDN